VVASHIENGEVWRQSSPQSACQLLKAVVNVIVTKTEAHEPEARIGRSLEEASHLGCNLIATALEACEVHLGHANPAQGAQDSCRPKPFGEVWNDSSCVSSEIECAPVLKMKRISRSILKVSRE